MATRKERLKKLVGVQEQLKALHEMRRAGFLAEAASAESEAAELRQRFDAEGSLSTLFPEIYHRRIDQAVMRAASNLNLAQEEAAACRRGDRPHQDGGTRLSRGQPPGRAQPHRPRTPRDDRARQART